MSTASDPVRRPHILGDIGLTVEEDGDLLRGTGDVSPHLWVPGTQSLRLSILATWSDILLGLVAIKEIAPRIPVTLELDVHLFDDVPVNGVVHSTARAVKAGRAVVVTTIDFATDDGTPIGLGHALFMAAPDPNLTMKTGSWAIESFSSRRGTLEEPLAKRAGCDRVASGVASLPLRRDLANQGRSLNGGLVALVAEEAVLSAAPTQMIASMSLQYLRPVRTGPAHARAEVRGGVGSVEVHDGEHGPLSAIATTRSLPALVPER